MNSITRIPKFRRCVLQNFPFIEQDFDALTDYELLCKVVEYLNKVIDSQNEVIEQTEHLISAFNALQSYVETFFANLDVQEEINNKLEQMAEDGTLQEIITTYLQSNVAWTFDTVSDMKSATNLVSGSYARTLGFRTLGDGGSALYHITNTGTANEMDIIAVGSLFANLVDPNNVKQFGAYGNGTTDDSEFFERAASVCNNLHIPEGNYLIGDVDLSSGLRLTGEKGTILLGKTGSDYIIRLDSNTTLEGINFDGNESTGNAIISSNLKDNIVIEDCALTDVANNGIVLTDTSNVKINGCNFSNVQDSSVLVIPSTKNVENIIVSKCLFANVSQQSFAYAIYFNSGDVYYVKNSTMQDCNVSSAGYGAYFPGGDNNAVLNCNAYNCSGWRGLWVHDSANIIVKGGVYASCARDGVYVSKAHNVVIDGVIAYSNNNNGIGIDGDQTAAGRYQTTATNKNVTVCNCIVFNNNQGGGEYCGIRIGGTGETNCTIVNNNIYDSQTPATHKRSIEAVANGSGHIVTGNICGASTQKGIECPSAVVLTDNTINGVGSGTLYDLSRSAIVGQGSVTISNQSVNNGANVLITYNPPTGYEVVGARYIPNTSTASGGVTMSAPIQWGSGVRVRLINNTGAAQIVEGTITFYYKLTIS